jgi:hypothetical protein
MRPQVQNRNSGLGDGGQGTLGIKRQRAWMKHAQAPVYCGSQNLGKVGEDV